MNFCRARGKALHAAVNSCYDSGKLKDRVVEMQSMSTAEKAKFAHRMTEGQRFESICLRCFRTVGSADFEPGLEYAEVRHTCLPEDVIRLHGRMEPESVRGAARKKDRA